MTDHHSGVSDNVQDSRGAPQDSDDASSPQTSTVEQKKSSSMVREVIETLLLALLIFVAVRAVVLNFRVDGHSMDSALADNEMLLVNRNAYFGFDQDQWLNWIPGVDYDEDDTWRPFGIPERGDIVVLNPPQGASADKPYIKRVIGVPGDTIQIRDNGVYINGIELVEPYLDEGKETVCRESSNYYCGPLDIPEGSVIVLGDNRDASEDSRVFGLVPIENIIGKAWITYWPAGNIGVADHFDYPELNGAAVAP
ncbi:MAG: signal peptidase I [Thermomicrobiales bacterium]